jgi:hypothetical protein
MAILEERMPSPLLGTSNPPSLELRWEGTLQVGVVSVEEGDGVHVEYSHPPPPKHHPVEIVT